MYERVLAVYVMCTRRALGDYSECMGNVFEVYKTGIRHALGAH